MPRSPSASGRAPRTAPFALRSLALGLALLVAGAGVPGGEVGAQVPSPADVLGYEIGDRFTDVAGVERYMRALADASPLVSVDTYGETPEGRPLVQVLIASPEHRGRMDEILRLNRELMDPGTPEARAREIAATNPAILYFTYGIHGNESSSPEAAIWTAWDLASGSSEVAGVLDSLVVVMDPAANPDGRDRYVNFYRSAAQARPNTSLQIRERREPWPGGRFNHYLFDLNRDWAWLSQPETRLRLERYLRYNPQVHVDFHEMGYNANYFFFPAARPVNPIYPGHILEWGERFGQGNARAMDREGLLYYTRQDFDLFYPSYGDSWPSLLGAIGMTYEQAGGGFGGRQIERADGTVLTLRDRAFGHRTTGNATLRTAMEGKTELLLGFAGFHRNVDEGLDPAYLLVPGPDRHRTERLVGLLLQQGIEVERLEGPVSLGSVPHPGFEARSSFPEGTYRVRTRQPRGRLAGALLRPENLLDATFSYDISAWALPFAYGVEAHSATGSLGGSWSPVTSVAEPLGAPLSARGAYGYLLEPSFGPARGLLRFLEGEGVVFAMADTFSLGGRSWPRGTLFFPQGRNQELDRRVEEAGLGGLVTPIATGLSQGGIDLGSQDASPLRLPRVALLGGEGTVATSFGAHWSFLEQELDLPFDVVNVGDVASVELGRYHVVVVPGGIPFPSWGRTGWRPSGDGSGGAAPWWRWPRRRSGWRSRWRRSWSGPRWRGRSPTGTPAWRRPSGAGRSGTWRAGRSGCPGPSSPSPWTRGTPWPSAPGPREGARTASSSSPRGWASSPPPTSRRWGSSPRGWTASPGSSPRPTWSAWTGARGWRSGGWGRGR
jgi:hypothetical protein